MGNNSVVMAGYTFWPESTDRVVVDVLRCLAAICIIFLAYWWVWLIIGVIIWKPGPS